MAVQIGKWFENEEVSIQTSIKEVVEMDRFIIRSMLEEISISITNLFMPFLVTTYDLKFSKLKDSAIQDTELLTYAKIKLEDGYFLVDEGNTISIIKNLLYNKYEYQFGSEYLIFARPYDTKPVELEFVFVLNTDNMFHYEEDTLFGFTIVLPH